MYEHCFVLAAASLRADGGPVVRTVAIPNGKKSIDHVIQQLTVELKAETIRLFDRAANADFWQPFSKGLNSRHEILRESLLIAESVGEYRAVIVEIPASPLPEGDHILALIGGNATI